MCQIDNSCRFNEPSKIGKALFYLWNVNYLLALLVQIIIYSLVWFVSEYTGLLLCIIMTAISGGIIFFAYAAEMIEKSKVPKSYFLYMWTMFLAPLIVGIAFSIIYEGNFDWLKG